MDFELIAAGDPYFANINPQQNNQPYLSQDLRVFSVAPAFNDTPINGAPRFTDHSFTGAYSWIQALLGYLNSTPSFTNPAGDDAFALLPGQGDEGQTDSSVAPFALHIPELCAELQLRDRAGTPAWLLRPDGCRVECAGVLPRLRQPEPRHGLRSERHVRLHSGLRRPSRDAAAGGGPDDSAVLCDCERGIRDRLPNHCGVNNQTVTIPAGSRDQTLRLLRLLPGTSTIPPTPLAGQQVQTLFPGTHHCIVAQIAYDDAPIPSGVSPMSWDQLAQRNLQLTLIDNPGPAATHRAPQTIDLRPSSALAAGRVGGLPPDELMIEWGDVPQGLGCVDLLAGGVRG